MKQFWNTIQLVFSLLGGWLGWFLGGSRYTEIVRLNNLKSSVIYARQKLKIPQK